MNRLASDMSCIVEGSPHGGLTVRTLRLATLTMTWDCVLPDGRVVPIAARRLKPVEHAKPVQRHMLFGGPE